MSKRYAIIGAGMMGREHIANLALVDGAELVALADPDTGSRQLSSQEVGPNVSIHADYMEMMDTVRPDAVIIASPNFTHRRVVEDIAPFGAALLIEKPMATTVEDARAMERLAAAYPALFWIGLEYRFMPPMQYLITEARAGRTGTIKMLTLRVLMRTQAVLWSRNAVISLTSCAQSWTTIPSASLPAAGWM